MRGFTLIELMVVVALVAIFAALAAPSVAQRMKARRVGEAAQRAAGLYTQARLRSMGRGSAVLVRFNNGVFSVLEAQLGDASPDADCAALPSSSCTRTNWDSAAANQFRALPGLDITNRGEYGTDSDKVTLSARRADASAITAFDICFTPMGQVYHRTSIVSGTPMTPLRTTYTVAASRPVGGSRRVLILPNGTARFDH